MATVLTTINEWMREPVGIVTHLFTWHAFGVLALLPGFIALMNLIPVGRAFQKTKLDTDKLAKPDYDHAKGKRRTWSLDSLRRRQSSRIIVHALCIRFWVHFA